MEQTPKMVMNNTETYRFTTDPTSTETTGTTNSTTLNDLSETDSSDDQDDINCAIVGAGLFVLICLVILLGVIIRKKSKKPKRRQDVMTSSDPRPGTSSAVHWTSGNPHVTLQRNGACDSALGYSYPSTAAIVGETDDYVIEDNSMTSTNLDPPATEPKEDPENDGVYVDVESVVHHDPVLNRGLSQVGIGTISEGVKQSNGSGVKQSNGCGVKQSNGSGISNSRSDPSMSTASLTTSRLRERTGFMWEVTVPITHNEWDCIGKRESSGVYIDMNQSTPTKRFSLTPPSPTDFGDKVQPKFVVPRPDLPLPPPPCGATSKHQYVNMRDGDPRTLLVDHQGNSLDLQKFGDDPSGYCFAHGLADASDEQRFTDDEEDHGDGGDAVYEIPGKSPLKLRSILQNDSIYYQNLENHDSLTNSLTEDFTDDLQLTDDLHLTDDPPEVMYQVPMSPIANTPKTPESDDGYYENATALLFESKLKSHFKYNETAKSVDTSNELVKKKTPPPVAPKTKRPTNNTTNGFTKQPPVSENASNLSANNGLGNKAREHKPTALLVKQDTEHERDSGLGLTKPQRKSPNLPRAQQVGSLLKEMSAGVSGYTSPPSTADDDDESEENYVNVSEIVKQRTS